MKKKIPDQIHDLANEVADMESALTENANAAFSLSWRLAVLQAELANEISRFKSSFSAARNRSPMPTGLPNHHISILTEMLERSKVSSLLKRRGLSSGTEEPASAPVPISEMHVHFHPPVGSVLNAIGNIVQIEPQDGQIERIRKVLREVHEDIHRAGFRSGLAANSTVVLSAETIALVEAALNGTSNSETNVPETAVAEPVDVFDA